MSSRAAAEFALITFRAAVNKMLLVSAAQLVVTPDSHAQTGTIHGRPLKVCEETLHKISASNAHGSMQVQMVLHVVEAPGFLRYAGLLSHPLP